MFVVVAASGVPEAWWCPGWLFDCMPLYPILVLGSGVWWSLLLDIHCLWRYNVISFYCTSILLARCCTVCHCNEHKLWALQVKETEAKHTSTRRYDRAVHNCKNIRQRFRTGE